MPEILIVSDDVAGPKMAGPGIRAWELSRELSSQFDVVLAVPDYSPCDNINNGSADIPFRIHRYSHEFPRDLEDLVAGSRIILTQGYILSKFPFLKDVSAFLIIDLYVPFPLENLFIHQKKISNLKDREYIHLHDIRVFNDQILHGDHFLCANMRQRDLIIGSLMSLNRIDPVTLDRDSDLSRLISIVPFGIRDELGKTEKTGKLRELFPEIRDSDLVLLWGGVLTNWFDPLTLINAVAEAVKTEPRVKLVFLSSGHPNPLLPEFDMARESLILSDDLGLTGRHVFFHTDWVGYFERGDYFRDADIGVSIHRTHFETYYSFRTRILDYLKYELPIICTEGDFFADLVDKNQLGIVVSSGDAAGLSGAILQFCRKQEMQNSCAANIRKIKSEFYWDRVAKPLKEYCHNVIREGMDKSTKAGLNGTADLFSRNDVQGKKLLRRLLWRPVHKLPLSISSKIKRLFKFLSR